MMIFCIILVLIGFILLQNLVRNDTINLNINPGDCFIFGSELRGLSNEVLKKLSYCDKIFIPMRPKIEV